MRHEDIAYQIYGVLCGHVGKKNAVPADGVAKQVGVAERKLRDYISEIRRSSEFEKIVCSSNNGYYIATEEEADRANRRLYSQAFSLLKTANANERKAGKNGQMRIRLDDFYKETVEAFGDK